MEVRRYGNITVRLEETADIRSWSDLGPAGADGGPEASGIGRFPGVYDASLRPHIRIEDLLPPDSEEPPA